MTAINLLKNGSVETGMNLYVLTRTMKIVNIRRPPPQGLSEARRDREVNCILVTDPPRGRPSGGGGVHRN